MNNDNIESLLTSILIAQARCYDVLLLILAESDEGAARKVREMHEDGELFMPAPSFVIEDDEDTSGSDSAK